MRRNYHFWHPAGNPSGFVSTALISCFLFLMKNSLGPFPKVHFCTFQILHPGPEHLFEGRVSAASNKQLPDSWSCGTVLGPLLHPSHLLVPSSVRSPHAPKKKKIPLAVQQSLSAVSAPSGRGSLAMRSSCRLLLRSRGPSEGHYCPFMGFTVWEVRRGRARRWVRSGNEGGLEVLAIAWDWSSSKSNSKAHTFGKRLLYNRWVWLRRTAQVMDKGIFIGAGLRWKRELDFAPTCMWRRSRDAQRGLAFTDVRANLHFSPR